MALTSLTNLQPLHVHSVGVSTFDGSVSVGGTLTYEDVTNVDAIGIVTARSGVNVSGGQLDVGSNIKLGNAGVITATSFVGSGANLTGIAADKIYEGNTEAEVVDTGSDGHFKVTTEGTERLRINSYGQVGINTSVGGQLAIAMDSSNTNPLATGFIALSLKNTNTTDNTSVCMDFNNSVGGIVGRFGAQFKDTSDKDTDLYFATRADGGSLAEVLRITSTGGLKFTGQTTTIETAGMTHHTNNNLYIRGGTSGLILSNDDSTNTIHISDSNYIKFETNDGNEKLRITDGGNLMLRSAAANYLVMGSSGDSGFDASISNNMNWIRGNQDNLQMNCATGGFMSFEAGGSEKLRITSTGQVRAGDESSSDRTSYRHQFSSTAGSGDVLSIQNPSNTDGQGIGLGFWARNTNNAAIEVGKIKAVADETQANSTQAGSLRFLTNKGASMGERMQINSSGNVRITGSTHSNQGTNAGNVPLQIVGGGNNVVTMFLGNGNTAGNGVNDYSADIRFNGAAVAWGDLSYYPTGNSNGGAFRFTGNGSTVTSQGNRSIGCSGIFINGTAQAQHLDDYEEGSYTPNVQTDNGVNCGMSAAEGYYVKVGKVVTVHLRIQTNSHNSVNTAAPYKVSLPYTSQAEGDTQGTLMCSIWSIGSSNISWMGGQVHNNNAWTHLAYHNGNNNNTNHLQPNVAGNQLTFRGTVVYRSDS